MGENKTSHEIELTSNGYKYRGMLAKLQNTPIFLEKTIDTLLQFEKEYKEKIEKDIRRDKNCPLNWYITEGILKHLEKRYVYHQKKEEWLKRKLRSNLKIQHLSVKMQKSRKEERREEVRQEIEVVLNAERYVEEWKEKIKEMDLTDLYEVQKYRSLVAKYRKYAYDSDSIREHEMFVYDIREYLGESFFEDVEGTKYLYNYRGELQSSWLHWYLTIKHKKKLNTLTLEEERKLHIILRYTRLVETYISIKEVLQKAKGNVSEVLGKELTIAEQGVIKYMRRKGYVQYAMKIPELVQIGVLMGEDLQKEDSLSAERLRKSFTKAREQIEGKKEGVFLDFLTREEESSVLSEVLNTDFPVQLILGDEGVLKREGIDEYVSEYRGYVRDLWGSVLAGKLEFLDRVVDKEMMYINYATSTEIGVLVKEYITEEDVPELKQLEPRESEDVCV